MRFGVWLSEEEQRVAPKLCLPVCPDPAWWGIEEEMLLHWGRAGSGGGEGRGVSRDREVTP